MSRYAKGTEVSVEKSRMEIERTLMRYGADAFAYAWQGPKAQISFRARDRYIRFTLPLPDPASDEFVMVNAGSRGRVRRSADAARNAWEQACRERWRGLALIIKAKLEAVESGIVTFESEFLAHTLLPNGETVGEWAKPQIAIAYQSGEMPKLLSGPH